MLKTYDELLDKAQSLGLKVFEDIALEDDLNGMIWFKTIALSEELVTERDKRVVLLEEITHFEKNTGNITDLKIHAHEEWITHKAMIEQVDIFEVIDTIIEFGENANTFNVSEALGIAEWFLKEIIDFYSCLPLKPFVYRKYIVSFNPFNVRPIEE